MNLSTDCECGRVLVAALGAAGTDDGTAARGLDFLTSCFWCGTIHIEPEMADAASFPVVFLLDKRAAGRKISQDVSATDRNRTPRVSGARPPARF